MLVGTSTSRIRFCGGVGNAKGSRRSGCARMLGSSDSKDTRRDDLRDSGVPHSCLRADFGVAFGVNWDMLLTGELAITFIRAFS